LTAVEGHRVRESPLSRPTLRGMCELLVGLPAVTVLDVEDTATSVVVHVELRTVKPGCPSCGVVAWVKDRPTVELVDLPAFGRPGPARLAQAPLVLSGPGLPGGLVHRRERPHRSRSGGDDGPGWAVGDGAGGPPRPHRGRGGPGPGL
jgi:hypothetical protein